MSGWIDAALQNSNNRRVSRATKASYSYRPCISVVLSTGTRRAKTAASEVQYDLQVGNHIYRASLIAVASSLFFHLEGTGAHFCAQEHNRSSSTFNMKATRAASMASPLLLLAAFSTRAFAQTPEPGTAPADTRNPGGIVVPSTTVLVGEPVVFTECECSISASVFTYTWPPVEISPGPVGARVTVKLDQAGNPVSTITASVDGLATDVYQNLEDIWNYALRTTGVSISDGSIPVITVTRTIYTEADEFFTTLQTM